MSPDGITVAERLRALRGSAWLERNLDRLLAVLTLLAGVSWLVSSNKIHGPFALRLAIVVGLAAAMVFRRRSPLAFAALSMALAVVASAWVSDIARTTWTLYLLLIPSYTIATYEELPRALVGLALTEAGPWAVDALGKEPGSGDFLFTTIMVAIAWVTGRALRSRRLLHAELLERANRLSAEREDRTRLAVADERTRIARELHAMVASHVSAMVVQAGAAKRMLGGSPGAADQAMLAIEDTGREALTEMRRILGVLRHSGDDRPALAPQPGVGQLHSLIESARADGHNIELHVDGEPGPLPFAVDLAVYRILEEALGDTAKPAGRLTVSLRFTAERVELELDCEHASPTSWPTVGMSERVASCDGRLRVQDGPQNARKLLAELPRAFEAAFA